MRWQTGRRSEHVEDRRGRSPMVRRSVGGGLGMVVLALIAMYFGVDPGMILGPGVTTDSEAPYSAPAPGTAADDELAEFVSVVLADTEDVWKKIFEEKGARYREPALVLFSDAISSACGFAQAASGPFYCPSDQKVYIDLSFYREMRDRFKAPGDFAQAYVIAHEVGHHVQFLTGIGQKVQETQRRVRPVEANRLSVMMELQADCYAGLWAHHAHRARQILEKGDVEEALNAASRIGDDHMQRQSRGRINPDTFTHGTSEQRVRWFTRGLQSGDLAQCDTFSADQL